MDTPSKFWEHYKWLTIQQAAALGVGIEPDLNFISDSYKRNDFYVLKELMEEHFQECLLNEFMNDTNKDGIDFRTTRFAGDQVINSFSHLYISEWAKSLGIQWPFKFDRPKLLSIDHTDFPIELRAAIEAFQAVKGMKLKTSPKKELQLWLEKHKEKYDNLSTEAIIRISTVSNWQKAGGAPKSEG
jgi:hypothetical protein